MLKARIKTILTLFAIAAPVAIASELSTKQINELTVFGSRAMGASITVNDIRNVLSRQELNQIVATGINLNGMTCAEVVDITPLQLAGTYEVTCIGFRGGNAQKSYVVNMSGLAEEI